jgi:hypothetical protein
MEATFKAEIINSAGYLNTKYKEDLFVEIVKSRESNQLNINSTIKTATKAVEELNPSSENSDKRKEHIQHRISILGESLKKKLESKVIHGQYIRHVNSLLVKKTHFFGCFEGRSESEVRHYKQNVMQTNITNRNR